MRGRYDVIVRVGRLVQTSVQSELVFRTGIQQLKRLLSHKHQLSSVESTSVQKYYRYRHMKCFLIKPLKALKLPLLRCRLAKKVRTMKIIFNFFLFLFNGTVRRPNFHNSS